MRETVTQSKILYIEDTLEARILVRRLLASRYQLVEAGDSLQGIELARDTRPDLILVDLHMPHLTGYEVATRLKAIMPETPIVALTADVTTNVRERVLASGCDGYLSKPIDVDTFVERIERFLAGGREVLTDERFREAYQQKLVTRLEEQVRELKKALDRNEELYEQNAQLLAEARRKARLLEAGARVGQSITSILDLDDLLVTTVDIICDEFGFDFAGIFLIENKWAVFRAGRGDAGQRLAEQGYKVGVDGQSLIGQAAHLGQARLARDLDREGRRFDHLLLPSARSEIDLPLTIGDQVIGVLNVQSTQETAFSTDDVTALQSLADQLAVAINNARLLQRLEETHQELVRTKTYEAIATATGEAIHWVGNKAAPIPGSIERITEDLVRYLYMANALLECAPSELQEHKFAQLLMSAGESIAESGIKQDQVLAKLQARPLKSLRRMLNVESIFEDLEIIQNSGQAILNIKEDLIGPARKRNLETISLPDLLTETVDSMGIPDDVVQMLFTDELSPVRADRIQLNRVFINLIKNAMEAMGHLPDKKLVIWCRPAEEPRFVAVDLIDNGVGIPPDQLDKIWMAFYTTKGDRGGTGLGLPACAQIVSQLGGKIVVESDVGFGTTFSVVLPVLDE
jgi:signal transduction histidine kinase/CheY-like chemotaxis protein